MYVLYLDESGDPGLHPRSTRHLVIGGAAVHEGQWANVSQMIDDLQSRYFPQLSETVELHCNDARKGNGIFRGMPPDERQAYLSDFYRSVGSHPLGLTLFSVALEKAALSQGEHPYERGLEDIFSRFDLFLRRQFAFGNPQKGMVVIDNSTLRDRLAPLLSHWRRQGTRWANIYNIIETTFFLDSGASRLVQVADHCASAVFQYYERGDSTHIDLILPKLDREPGGGKLHGLRHVGTGRSCACYACMQRGR